MEPIQSEGYAVGTPTGEGTSVTAAAGEQARQAGSAARDAALRQVGSAAGGVAGRLDELASGLEQVVEVLEERGFKVPPQISQKVVSTVRQVGTQLRGKSGEQLWRIAKDELRRRPGLWFASCLALGFASIRLARS